MSQTVENARGQERSSWDAITPCNELWKNVYGTVTVRSRSRFKNERLTEGGPNLSVYRVRTVFREGPFWSTAQRIVLF
jgi:hypothetical protein